MKWWQGSLSEVNRTGRRDGETHEWGNNQGPTLHVLLEGQQMWLADKPSSSQEYILNY